MWWKGHLTSMIFFPKPLSSASSREKHHTKHWIPNWYSSKMSRSWKIRTDGETVREQRRQRMTSQGRQRCLKEDEEGGVKVYTTVFVNWRFKKKLFKSTRCVYSILQEILINHPAIDIDIGSSLKHHSSYWLRLPLFAHLPPRDLQGRASFFWSTICCLTTASQYGTTGARTCVSGWPTQLGIPLVPQHSLVFSTSTFGLFLSPAQDYQLLTGSVVPLPTFPRLMFWPGPFCASWQGLYLRMVGHWRRSWKIMDHHPEIGLTGKLQNIFIFQLNLFYILKPFRNVKKELHSN